MHIVNIIGNIDNLYRNPVMNPIVQNTSANMARQSESLLPIPITLGNEFESIVNPASFCSPCEMNIAPNTNLANKRVVDSITLW